MTIISFYRVSAKKIRGGFICLKKRNCFLLITFLHVKVHPYQNSYFVGPLADLLLDLSPFTEAHLLKDHKNMGIRIVGPHKKKKKKKKRFLSKKLILVGSHFTV